MTSKRETNLAALHAILAAVPGYAVLRNSALGDIEGTFVSLQDGEIEQTDEFFNPTVYEFTARPVLLVIVQGADAAARDSALDDAIEAFWLAIEAAVPFGAGVTDVRVLPPDTAPREVFGALDMKGAEVPIEIDYWTDSPAG